MRIPLLVLIVATGLVGLRAAAAQQSAAADAPAASASAPQGLQPEVTVLGRRLKLAPRVQSFVYGITQLKDNQGLARWNSPVCPRVTGLPREQGEFVLERIAEIARAAHVPLGGEDCKPNLFIFLTTQPKELLLEMDRRKHWVTFGDAMPLDVSEFINDSRPVKVWYNSSWVQPGAPLLPGLPPGIQIQGGGGFGSFATVNSPMKGSHIFNAVAYSFSLVYVIADQTQLRGVSLRQFADYAAMVGLSEIRPTPHLQDRRSILTLFGHDPAAAPSGLDEWDSLFLKYLYVTDGALKAQRSAIGWNMVRDLVR